MSKKITELTANSTIVDTDQTVFVDVSDTTQSSTGTNKKTAWSLIKSTLKTYFDTQYIELPTEGTSGQVLTTDGAGGYTWEDASGGANLPTPKTGTSIVFTENAEYYADGSYNPNTSGNITLDLTDAVIGTSVAVFVSGYAPTISGEDYIQLSDTSNGVRDIYYFYYAHDGLRLNIIGEGVLTTPVVTLTPADEQITVDWTASVGATSYTVLRNTSNTVSGATTIYTGALLTFDDTGLTNGTTYYYFVQATGGTGKWDSAYGTNSDAPEEYPSTAFVLNITTNAAGGASGTNQFTMATYSSGSYNCTVDWGDGNSDTITTYNDAAWTHTYSGAGSYKIIITGIAFTGMNFNNGGDRTKVDSIEQWGIFKFGGNIDSFEGCSNMTITAADAPNLTGVTTLQGAFYACTSLTSLGTLSLWDTSTVTSFGNFLRSCTSFNQDLSDLDTSAATTLASMLRDCTSFNNGLPTATMSSLTTVASMLAGCTSFNSDISNLDLSTAAAVNCTSFLDGATSFNHVSAESLDVSKVTHFGFFFRSTSIDRSFASWDTRACLVSQGVGFLDNVTISTSNYDATLIGWDTRTPYNAVAWDFNNATYTSGGAAETARTSLIGKGLSFTDGGGV